MSLNKDPNSANILTESEMVAASAYSKADANKDSNRKSKRVPSLNSNFNRLKRDLDEARSQINKLHDAQAKRAESTPTIAIKEDNISLVYTGKVAGKTATRDVPFVQNENVKHLKPLLTPIVAVLNAALRSKQLEETPVMIPNKDDPKGKKIALLDEDRNPIMNATALTKAMIAYDQLLANPEVVQKLEELSEVINNVYEHGISPSKVDTISYKRSSVSQRLKDYKVNPQRGNSYSMSLADESGTR